MAVTSQQIIDFLLANPGMSDAQIVAAMEQYGISPAQMATAVGLQEGEITARVAATVPPNQTITLGDTIVQPQYQVTGSGENQQIGGIENVLSYKTGENKVGGGYTQYTPTGEVARTGTQQAVNPTADFLKFAALTGAGLYGLGALGGGAAGAAGSDLAGLSGIPAGTGALTAAESAALYGTGGAAAGGTGLLTTGGVTGMGAGTGITAGAGGLGLTTGGAGLGAAGVGAGLTGATGIGGGLGTAVGGLTTGVGGAAGTGLLTAAAKAAGGTIGNLISSGLTTAGGIMQGQTSKEAAQAAQARIDAETAAAKAAAQFKPVGMTTRFGTSNFQVDPVTGQLTSAGYTLSPEAKAAQDRFVKLAESGLTQAEGAQKAFEPLQTGAQSLFNLGNQYLAKSPEQVAQDYLSKQMALLQPGRELELANLQNKLQQQGRAGLSVAQGGNLGATTPELQALFNARAQQEALLAANAQQAGQQQVQFGAGLLNTGAQTMGQYYGGQQAAYSPYTTAMNQIQGLETAGQQPFTMGINLGQQSAQAGANVGRLGLTGAGQSVALATGPAATNNPYATALSGLGSSGLLGSGIEKAIGNQLDPGASYGGNINPFGELISSVVTAPSNMAPKGPMNINTADLARSLGFNLPTGYTGTTTTVNPLSSNNLYAF